MQSPGGRRPRVAQCIREARPIGRALIHVQDHSYYWFRQAYGLEHGSEIPILHLNPRAPTFRQLRHTKFQYRTTSVADAIHSSTIPPYEAHGIQYMRPERYHATRATYSTVPHKTRRARRTVQYRALRETWPQGVFVRAREQSGVVTFGVGGSDSGIYRVRRSWRAEAQSGHLWTCDVRGLQVYGVCVCPKPSL